MREWVNRNAGKVNELDQDGNLLLHSAAKQTSSSFVAELMDKYGADVSKRLSLGTTALHCASSAATVSVLLERGADPTAVDKLNETPLTRHARHGFGDCVERLLEETGALATINIKDKCQGRSALHETYTISLYNRS